MAQFRRTLSAPLSDIPHLGPASIGWLEQAGITTQKALREIGPVGAYRLLKQQGRNVTLNLVYAIHAGLDGRDWRSLSDAEKQGLKRAAQDAVRPRCGWCGSDPLYVRYHDEEWGVPSHDDRHLFEMLILEGAQAGLSWSTILNRREGYRAAFAGFDAERVARFGARDFERLMRDEGIVRNRLKIEAATKNARAFLAVQEEFGRFEAFIWPFVEGKPLGNRWSSVQQVPPRTAQSDAMSKDLQKRGFSFVGSTICYAFMQAVGMVNDHLVSCFRHRAVARFSSTVKGTLR